MTESAIRARFVRDSFHSLSTGLPQPSRGLARMPYLPLAIGRTAGMRGRIAALYLRGLGSKIGRSLGYFIGPSRRGRRCRILWRAFPPLARGLVRSSVRPTTAAPVFAPSIAAFTADALAWNL